MSSQTRERMYLRVLLSQPSLDCVGTVLRFPFFQNLVVAALGFDDFAGVRVLVDLYGTWLAGAGLGLSCCCTTRRGLWVNCAGCSRTLLAAHGALFRIPLTLQAFITFHCFQGCELFGQVFFKLTEFCETRHLKILKCA